MEPEAKPKFLKTPAFLGISEPEISDEYLEELRKIEAASQSALIAPLKSF